MITKLLQPRSYPKPRHPISSPDSACPYSETTFITPQTIQKNDKIVGNTCALGWVVPKTSDVHTTAGQKPAMVRERERESY